MYTILILCFGAAFFGLLFGFDSLINERGFYNKVSEFLKSVFSFALVGGFCGTVISLVLAFVFCFFQSETDYVRTSQDLPIVSMKDVNGMSGSFFLGCGYIESKMKYIAYYKTSETSFRMLQVDADSSSINYTKDNPHVTIRYRDFSDSWRMRLSIVSAFSWLNNEGSHQWTDGYDFYIPEGSIKTGFSL